MDLEGPGPATDGETMVAASAVIELSSLVCSTCRQYPGRPKVDIPDRLIDRAATMFGDGRNMLAELVVLADAVGMLRLLDVGPLLDRLRDPVVFPGALPLESESDEDRTVINDRLRRLAGDRRLRTRYVGVLTELWACYSDRWEATERALAEAAAAHWRQRLDAGADAVSLLPERHIAGREEFAPMTRRAQREGRLRLTPTIAGYGHIVTLAGGDLSVSSAVPAAHPVVDRRAAATRIAEELRVLSEPTRLTILAHLAQGPAGVSDLARSLHIAQPTASVHLRRLRDAGLVEAHRNGAHTVYELLPHAVPALLDDLSARLARELGATA